MPVDYEPSSGSNTRLVRLGKRFRGGPAPDLVHTSYVLGTPLGLLGGHPQEKDWCGHAWSDWTPLTSDIQRGI